VIDALRSRGYRSLIHVPAPLITIVDDDDSMRASLDNLLRSVGFRAQAFPSAESFLHATPGLDTACLILDVRMPGMSGLELQQQLAVAFLYKPFRKEELLDAIDGILMKQPEGGGS
jgi:FixJ family two-component response regulator